MNTGDAMEMQAVTHMAENTGNTEVKVLIVEMKHMMGEKPMMKKKME